ncbi:hypothetical protein ACIRG8_16825 [Streptomyces sp. NPDC102359]|uniref:hypothetical protein n=1 Tax=Streptomyces sp. NPDC102359 TaxID=3366159 RepID=UPI0038037851
MSAIMPPPAAGLPAGDSVRCKALPGTAGEVWRTGRASDGRDTDWNRTVARAPSVAFGFTASGTPSNTGRTAFAPGGTDCATR